MHIQYMYNEVCCVPVYCCAVLLLSMTVLRIEDVMCAVSWLTEVASCAMHASSTSHSATKGQWVS